MAARRSEARVMHDVAATGGTDEQVRLLGEWRARALAHVAGAEDAFDAQAERLCALAAALLRADTAEDDAGEGAREALRESAHALGRAARVDGVAPAVLAELFAVLPAALLARDAHANAGRAPERAERGLALAAEALAATCGGWLALVEERAASDRATLEELGRVVRHDVKTPLQAASLNLELLALECAEKGIDTEPLETIQRSLDSAIEMLGRAERVG